MGKHKYAVVIPIVLSLISSRGWTQTRSLPMFVNSSSAGESIASAPASGMVTRSGTEKIIFKINNTCFATNLRAVTNPLAPSSTIKASVVLVIGSKEYSLYAEYSANLVTKWGLIGTTPVIANPTVVSNPAGSTGAVYGNSMIFYTPFPTTVTIDSSGAITDADKGNVYIKSASFDQVVNDCSSADPVYGYYFFPDLNVFAGSTYSPTYACGDFMGKNGPLSATIGSLDISSDKTNIELNVSFPGQTGFCGGFWSPLMVFFDEARPRFDNVSGFPLNPSGQTFWPEANHVGYFLALDRDNSGKIDQKNELFGDNGQDKNGFEVLKEFNTHRDSFIDKRDKAFAKLVLWQDKNGDGVSQAEELTKLSEKLTKISLNYKDDTIRSRGAYAEERQRSQFWFKNRMGKIQKGEIIDIWLAPFQQNKLSYR